MDQKYTDFVLENFDAKTIKACFASVSRPVVPLLFRLGERRTYEVDIASSSISTIEEQLKPPLEESHKQQQTQHRSMPTKRTIAKIEPGAHGAQAPKRSRHAASVKQEGSDSGEDLKERFIDLFSQEQYKDGVSNSQLESIFGHQHVKLIPVINELSQQSRITMSMLDGKELFYKLVPEEVASKFAGLDANAHLV